MWPTSANLFPIRLKHALDRFFWPIFMGCAALCVLPLWMGKYLPMTDLPQHAAQVSIVAHYRDPAYGFADQFKLDWLVPYNFSYILTALLAKLVGVLLALKIVVTLAVLGFPLSLYLLLKNARTDRWWSLAGFLLAYNYSFYWGFFSHIVAIPIGIAYVAMVIPYASYFRFRARAAWTVALLSLLSFFSHAIVFGVCSGVAGLIVLTHARSIKSAALRLLPLFAPTVVMLRWLFAPEHDVPKVRSYTEWAWKGWERFNELPWMLVANWRSSAITIVGLGLIVSVAAGMTHRNVRWRYVPAWLFAWLAFYFAPHHAMDISLIYQRLAVFVFTFGLLVFSPACRPVQRVLSRVGLSVLVVVWLGVLCARFRGFNDEARDFDRAMAGLPMNQSVLSLIYDKGSAFFSEEVFNHFPAWYQAEKGGKYSFSFAFSYKSMARYKPGREILPAGQAAALGNPNSFNWEDDGVFDTYVVRRRDDPTQDLFKKDAPKVTLYAHSGWWWVYRKAG